MLNHAKGEIEGTYALYDYWKACRPPLSFGRSPERSERRRAQQLLQLLITARSPPGSLQLRRGAGGTEILQDHAARRHARRARSRSVGARPSPAGALTDLVLQRQLLVASENQLGITLRVDELGILPLQIRVGDPTGLCATPSDVDPELVLNRELHKVLQRRQAHPLKTVAHRVL